jgi:transposase-like protein
MLGFKLFGSAATTISGIDLMHRIRKDQSISRRSTSRISFHLFHGMLSCLIDKASYL